MADSSGSENRNLGTNSKQTALSLKRVIVVIKDLSILAVIFYLVYFVAGSIVYRNEQNVLLSFIYRLGSTAYGIASAFLLYAIAHIIDQYKKED
jgi:hypothetical protein